MAIDFEDAGAGPAEESPIEHSLAAELTGTVGLADDTEYGDAVGSSLADAVEEYDQHLEQKLGEQRHVPLRALQEERTRRQQLQAQLQATEQGRAELEQRFQQFQQQLQAQQLQAQRQAEEAAIPNFSEDPEGYIKAKEMQFARALEAQQQTLQAHQYERQAQQQVAQIQAEVAQVHDSIVSHEAEFAAANPDYTAAADLVHSDVRQKLQQQFPRASGEELNVLHAVATAQFVQQCRQNGVDPCAYVYEKAQQMGFRRGSGAPIRSAPAPRQPVPRSLSDVAGAADPRAAAFTLENIASMSDAEFDQAWAAMAKSGKPKFAF